LTLRAEEAIEEVVAVDAYSSGASEADASMVLLGAGIAAARPRALLVTSERLLALLGLVAASSNTKHL
jgi:hypothetical protein